MKLKGFSKYIPILVILSLSLLGYSFGIHKYLDFQHLKQHQVAIELFLLQHQILSLLLYASVYILSTGLSIPGAAFLTIVGGYLFGQVLGTLVVVISATLGACVIFLSVKLALSEILLKKSPAMTV